MKFKGFMSSHNIKSNPKNIGIHFIESEEEVRKIANKRGYEQFDVELVTFNKIGFRRYLVVWRVVGRLET